MAAAVRPSYLTCTAAQAQEFNECSPHHIVSLNQLLETRATSHPQVRVAGFPEYILDEGRWQLLTFTFASLLSVSDALATFYLDNTTLTVRGGGDKGNRIVALLSPSCADLLATLFAAIRLGYGILLLAPQNTPEAIAHLCRVTNAAHLICHDTLLAQAQAALEALDDVVIVHLAPRTAWDTPSRRIRPDVDPELEKDLTALVMHTSGSTGMPKPIYHPHRIWTEAIPCMPGEAAFTTTPLFHGGSADLLRSLNAISTLYLFSSTYPMTVKNIVDAVAACHGTDAFLSVPYILKMLAEHRDGLEMLRTMSLVSTGGAPLPEALGNDMVCQGVRLVSRLGSSECGFLMSSHRDYKNDKEWIWLRNHGNGTHLLHFEPMGDSEREPVFELVVDKKWTTRVVSNRPDGSFASGDLYAKHPTIPDAWRYHGRTDDIVVLVTGKKVSANPIETALRACPSVSEAIVFGAERPALGVIILPASASTPRDAILQCVHLVNASQSSYAQILDDLVILLTPDAAPRIPKTSKGSVIRPKALSVFAEMIDEAYEHLENGTIGVAATTQEGVPRNPTEDEVRDYLKGIVSNVLQDARRAGKGIASSQVVDEDEDLFNAGIDSVRAVVIRSSLQKLVVPHGKSLSNNIVFEHPSITRLSQHVVQVIDGRDDQASDAENPHRLMLELVETYSLSVKHVPNGTATAHTLQPASQVDTTELAILTGVTGSLGAHVMVQILSRTSLRVVALVRASSDAEALERLKANLGKRKLLRHYEVCQDRVMARASDLTKAHLGLGDEDYNYCLQSAIAIVHIAWPVNFAMSVNSFKPALEGTRNLLEFTSQTRREARFIFCSSTAAAAYAQDPRRAVPESICADPRSAAAMGYAQAKWVAEHICCNASRTVLDNRVVIARVGQLCGDTEHGVWNESEAWPLLIASVRYTGCLPIFVHEELSLLPLDIAAAAFVDIIEGADLSSGIRDHVPVVHIVNPAKIEWVRLLDFLGSSGVRFRRTLAPLWIGTLEACSSLDPATQGLIGLWKNKCAGDQSAVEEFKYEMGFTRRTSTSIARLECEEVVTLELVQKWIVRWRATGFL